MKTRYLVCMRRFPLSWKIVPRNPERSKRVNRTFSKWGYSKNRRSSHHITILDAASEIWFLPEAFIYDVLVHKRIRHGFQPSGQLRMNYHIVYLSWNLIASKLKIL